MSSRRTLSLILTAIPLALAACSPSGSGNITATDNSDTAALSNDAIVDDDAGATGNSVLVNDLLDGNSADTNRTATP